MLNIEEKINNEDWLQFNGPEDYDAKLVPIALMELVNLKEPKNAEYVGSRLISAIANDHMGVYYPVVLKSLWYIITIASSSTNSVSKTCALGVLNDLYYFEPYTEGFNGCSEEGLKRYVKDTLEPYSDENIKF